MKRMLLAVALVVAGLAWVMVPGTFPMQVAAQDEAQADVLFRMPLDEGALPVAPAFIRLLRINMQPEANSPLHTHPGSELWRIEAGEVTLFVQGPTLLARADDPSKIEQAPQNSEFVVTKGDLVAMLPGTAMTFTNKGSDVAKIMAVVMLPAGSQRPVGITYLGQKPTEEAFVGIQSDILGDGVASALPTGPSVVQIDRVKLTSGQPMPAITEPVLYSVARGGLDFTIESGSVQVSRTAEPGPQADAAPGTSFSLTKGDAAFFPAGMDEAARGSALADVTLYKLTVVPTGDAVVAATPVANGSGPGVIQITGPAGAEPTEEATTAATAEATEPAEPTSTAEPSAIAPGATVYVTENDVRLRSAPSTEGEIVTGLVKGQVLIVTGPSEQGSDITWWPVQDANDASIAGYVAEQFLSIEVVEPDA